VILHPAVVALVGGSLVVSGLLLGAAWHAVRVLRAWDLSSGSALQLALERRTYLVSATVGWALAFELAALVLYVYAADALAPMFTGAMCAAGTLAANGYGYPALLARLAVSLAAALWLVLNHADGLGHDYPLVRAKYGLLLVLALAVPLEGWLQARFFLGLRPEVITSCCGSLFSTAGRGAGAALAALPPVLSGVALFAPASAAAAAGAAFRWTGRGALAVALALAAALALPAALVAVVSYLSPYVYELPAHRCPFCLLRPEYGRVGYPLYASLLGAAACGIGAGVLAPARRIESLAVAVPALQRRLATAAAVLFAAFAATAAALVLRSGLAG
jgi:hypothetical protein